MRCILGKEDGVHLPEVWEQEFLYCETLLYAGFLWPDITDCEDVLSRFHQRLLSDFQCGWSAVALTVKGATELGPYGSPTTARAHSKAPLGLYLLSADRLRRALALCQPTPDVGLASALHQAQRGLGCFFCDPQLEVELESRRRDYHYTPPGLWERMLGAAHYLFAAETSA